MVQMEQMRHRVAGRLRSFISVIEGTSRHLTAQLGGFSSVFDAKPKGKARHES